MQEFYSMQCLYLFSKDMVKESEEDNTLQSEAMDWQN